MLDKHCHYHHFRADLLSGKTTCEKTVQAFIEKIKQSKTNAFVEVFEASALGKAKQIDEDIKAQKVGKLSGMVIGIKDNICYKNHKVGAASKILEGYESIYSATVVERLEAQGAIIIGRLNCDEFAMGSSNEKSVYGPVKNPHDMNCVAGGSSGGSSASVAEGLCMTSLGSDTGGSIRVPASFCGVFGYKPTYGSVSRYGLIPYASSFDQISPVSNNMLDLMLIMEVISGVDEKDSTSYGDAFLVENAQKQQVEQLKIAYYPAYLEHEGIDKEIKNRTYEVLDLLKSKGHIVEPLTFDYIDYMVPNYFVLTTAEAFSNLARFDGVHYGYQSPNAESLEDIYIKSRSEGFGEEVKKRILLGSFVLSSKNIDEYYTKAQKVRRLIYNETKVGFEKYDIIITPTTPCTAFEFGAKNDQISMYLQDIFTVQANLSGVPAISIPIGVHSNKMPFGVHLMGDSYQDEKLMAFSSYLYDLAK